MIPSRDNTPYSVKIVDEDGEVGCGLWTLPADSISGNGGTFGGLTWPAEQTNNRVWVLDVDGVRLVISAFWASDAKPADLDELQAVIDSIQFVRPGSTAPPVPAS